MTSISFSEESPDRLVEQFLVFGSTRDDLNAFVAIFGGQDRRFLRRITEMSGAQPIAEESVLRGLWKVLRFLPSRSALVALERGQEEAPIVAIRDAAEDVSLFGLYWLKIDETGDFKRAFRRHDVDGFLGYHTEIPFIEIDPFTDPPVSRVRLV